MERSPIYSDELLWDDEVNGNFAASNITRILCKHQANGTFILRFNYIGRTRANFSISATPGESIYGFSKGKVTRTITTAGTITKPYDSDVYTGVELYRFVS